MKRVLGIILYLFLAIMIGWWFSEGIPLFLRYLLGINFKWFSSEPQWFMLLPPDIPMAIKLGLQMAAILLIFFYLGKKFVKNRYVIILACLLILVYSWAFPFWGDFKEEKNKERARVYALSHESEGINQVNICLSESGLPFCLDLAESHYDTLYENYRYNSDYLRCYLEKTIAGRFTDEEIYGLLDVLPQEYKCYSFLITSNEDRREFNYCNCLSKRFYSERLGIKSSKEIDDFNQAISEAKLPFSLNLEASYYDFWEQKDGLCVEMGKNDETELTVTEISQLFDLLPLGETSYRLKIFYGKMKYVEEGQFLFKRNENFVTLLLDQNKKIKECNATEQEFCQAIIQSTVLE